jgi:serine protease AprX
MRECLFPWDQASAGESEPIPEGGKMKRLKSGGRLVFILILATLIMLPSLVSAHAMPKGKVKPKPPLDTLPDPQPIMLEDVLGSASESQKIPVIVQFQPALTEAEYDLLGKRLGAFALKHRYSIIPGMAAGLTKGQINALSRMPFVRLIEYDNPVYAFLDSATQWFGVDDAVIDSSATGDDITIAVIDTGIDVGHVDLDKGKVVGWKDYVGGRPRPYDDHGHGTHVSSIAAGTGEADPAYRGVAPGASLVGVKVIDSIGYGWTSDVIAGVNWCVDNKDRYGIRIINLSLGSRETSDSLSSACTDAVNAGIVVVAAAGNWGPGINTVGCPGNVEEVITVGNMVDIVELGFYQSHSSSRGDPDAASIKPDISAPGYRITAAKAGTGTEYFEMTGTSMASPFIAGVTALILDREPALSPDAVKLRIMDTAQDWGRPGKDINYGAGRLDGYRAIIPDCPASKPDMPNLSHFYRPQELLPRTGASDYWSIEVIDNSYPIAVTLIMDEWAGNNYDFDVYLYDPNQNLIDLSINYTRQEMIGCQPASTGIYTLEVYSYSGSGPYSFDLSAGASEPGLIYNDYVPQAHDVAITSINVDSELEQAIGTVNVDVVVENEGTFEETTTITLTDTTGNELIGSQVVTNLTAGSSQTVTFDWNVASALPGQHILLAEATSVPEETDTDDNDKSKVVNVVIGTLQVDVTISGTYKIGELVSIEVTVTHEASPVKHATVNVTITTPKGKSYIQEGLTDGNGEAVFPFKPKRNDGTGTYHVTAAASKLGYNSGEGGEGIFDVTAKAASASVAVKYVTQLWQAFPGPGNPEIWIPFTLSDSEHVVVRIYNAAGRLVRTLDLGEKSPGAYLSKERAAYWDGRNTAGEKVTSGIYFYSMEAGSFRAMKKLVVLK